jgi:ATP-binding cassette subfamily B protein
MPPQEYGYMEGEQLGRPYDLRLLKRLSAFARPFVRWIILAAGLILLSTALELYLPYLTRTGIDQYIVRTARRVDTDLAGPELTARLRAEARADLMEAQGGGAFLPEPAWRGLDHRLAQALKEGRAVESTPWRLADLGDQAQAIAAAHPGLFVTVEKSLLIRAEDLARLASDELAALRGPDIKGLAWLAALFLATASAVLALGYGQQVLLERTGQEMMLAIRQRLFRHLLSRSLDFFGVNPVGKLVTRLTNDVQNLNDLYTSTLVALFQDLFLLAGIVVVLLWLDAGLALICLCFAPLVALLAWLFSRLARDAFRDLQGHLGRINSRLSETLSGLMVVKLFRAQDQGRAQFESLNQAYYAAGLRQIKVFSIFMPLIELLSSLVLGIIIWQGGGQVVAERLSLGTLVAFVAYMQMFFRPVRDIAEKYNIMQSALASGERIFELLDDPRALPFPDQPRDPVGPGELRLENVTFGYDPARPVLKDLSFTIPPGRTWAVVGPTGAGKTSLVALLLRLYDPQEGRVLIDGVDLRRITPEALARRMAVVSQEVTVLAGTVEQNLNLGRLEATPEALARALAVSGAEQFVGHLPQGLATPLGEGGRRLSSGQRQLLALARALAGEPRVLILDEATSSVDPESERIIQEALPRVMAGRTSLVVAHRLTTIRHADHILVMARGRVVEQGRHEDLMAAGGLYARLVRLQQLGT